MNTSNRQWRRARGERTVAFAASVLGLAAVVACSSSNGSGTGDSGSGDDASQDAAQTTTDGAQVADQGGGMVLSDGSRPEGGMFCNACPEGGPPPMDGGLGPSDALMGDGFVGSSEGGDQ